MAAGSEYSSSVCVPVMKLTDYSDQMKSTATGVDVDTVELANRCRPAFAFAFATAGTPHSSPPGGNSSHIDPDVAGTNHSPRIVSSAGRVDHVLANWQTDAGDEKSCATPSARPAPEFVTHGLDSVNKMSFPTAAS